MFGFYVLKVNLYYEFGNICLSWFLILSYLQSYVIYDYHYYYNYVTVN